MLSVFREKERNVYFLNNNNSYSNWLLLFFLSSILCPKHKWYHCFEVFHVQELLIAEPGKSMTPIEEDVAEISIPSEVLANQEDGNPIRMASFLFRNMSGLLPQRLSSNGAENDRYGSTTTSFGSPRCLFHIPVSNFYGGQVPILCYTLCTAFL